MTNIQFMCVADAVRAANGKFDRVLDEAINLAVSRMAGEDLHKAFFAHQISASQSGGWLLSKAA